MNFMKQVPVDVMMMSEHKKTIVKNRKIVSSVISTIVFCATHDTALRGKDADSGK